MSNKKDLKAYVRYDGNGRIIPGSLILNRFKPAVGKWQETPAYECCNPSSEPDCSKGGFWIDTIGDDQFSYLQCSTMDDKCNLYTLSTIGQGVTYRKFDSSGALVWEKFRTPDESSGCYNWEFSEIKLGPDGNLYILKTNSIAKINTTDGSIINEATWSNSNCTSTEPPIINFEYFVGMEFDKNGNIFISAQALDVLLVVKVNAATLTVVSSKLISITDASFDNGYTNNAPLVDSEGNVIVYLAWEGQAITGIGNIYQSTIFKLDNNLNEIWNTRIDENESIVPGDGDLTSICLDAYDNIYCNGYGTHIYKLDKNGVLQWTRGLDSIYVPSNDYYFVNLSVTPEGDVYWIGEADNSFVCPPPGCATIKTLLFIIKYDTNGNYQWVTTVENTDTNYMHSSSFDVANDGSLYKNKSLLILADDYSDERYFLMKLPLTQVLGTYGIFVFSDATSVFNNVNLTTTSGATLHTIEDVDLISIPNAVYFDDSIVTTVTNTII